MSLPETLHFPDAAQRGVDFEPVKPWVTATLVGFAVSVFGHAIVIGLGLFTFEQAGSFVPPATTIPIVLVPDPNAARATDQKPLPQPERTPSPPQPTPPQAAAKPQPSANETAPRPAAAAEGAPATSVVTDTKATGNDLDALRAQVQACWTIPPGWTSPKEVSVTVGFRMNTDGTVAGRPAVIEFPATPIGKIAAENALRAVVQCGPYHLPAGKDPAGRDVQIRLTPAG